MGLFIEAYLKCAMIDIRFKVNHAGKTNCSRRVSALLMRTPAEAWSSVLLRLLLERSA